MNYQINILPVTSNKSAVLDLLLRFLGPDQKDMVEILIKSGGTVLQNMNKQTATKIANQLRKLGVGVEITPIDPDEVNKRYLIRLLSTGKYKVRVVKLVHELTELGLKESKRIVDELSVVAENLSKREAEKIGKMLEAAGAQVRIDEMYVKDPEPEPEPEPETQPDPELDTEDFKSIYGNLTDENGKSLAKFTLSLDTENIQKWLSLLDIFKDKEKR